MVALEDWSRAEPRKQLGEYARHIGNYAAPYLYPGAFHGVDVPGAKERHPTPGARVQMGINDNVRESVHKDSVLSRGNTLTSLLGCPY